MNKSIRLQILKSKLGRPHSESRPNGKCKNLRGLGDPRKRMQPGRLQKLSWRERQQQEEEDAKRFAEKEARRLAVEEAKRLAAEEAKRLAAAEEAKCLGEVEAGRIAEVWLPRKSFAG